MPRPKLIAIDIDGTLINSETKLTQRVCDSVKRAISDGAMVTLATGRMISAASEFIEKIGINLPIIALNGSLVGWHCDGKPPVYHEPFGKNSARAIINEVWDSDTTLIFVRCDSAYGRNITELTGQALASWIVNIAPLDKREDIEEIEPTTILVAGLEKSVGRLHSAASALSLEDVEHFFFPSIRYFPMHYVELRAKGTNKGKALAMLAKNLEIEKQDILAIGDYLNDLPMADYAGVFATPSNAQPEVRKVADYISPFSNDEDAVAEILETLYFQRPV